MELPPHITTWLGHPWRRRDWGVPLLAAGAVWVTAGAVHTISAPFWAGLLLGLVLIVVVLFAAGSGHRFHQAIQLHLFASAVWATVFLTWASVDAAWSHPKMRMLTLVVGLLWPVFAIASWKHARMAQIGKEFEKAYEWRLRQQPPPQIAAPAPARPVNPHAELWEGMFAKWGVNELEYRGQRATQKGNREVRMRLPAHGAVRFSQVLDKAENVEIALASRGQKLPPGSIRINRVRHRDGTLSSTDFVIMIDLVDILSHIQWMPDDHTPRSIKEKFQIGVFQNGTPIYMTVQEIHWAIVAMTRAGKSNLLHVIIYQVSRCYDAVIWMIDMKGASTLKPWMRAWFDRALHPDTGKPVLRPVIDWAAVDKHEGERILNAFIEIAADRPFRRQGSKTRVTREHPHIFLIGEEISRLLGTHTNKAGSKAAHSSVFGNLFIDASAIGAGEACTFAYAVQRNTVDNAIPGNAQANVKGRICLGGNDLQDIRMVLPKNPMASSVALALRHQGSLVIAEGTDDEALAGRSFFMGDDEDLDARTYEAGLLHGNIVPGLTEGTPEYVIAGRWGYEDRFDDPERFGWMAMATDRVTNWVGKPIEDDTPEPAAPGAIPTQPTASTGFFTPPPTSQQPGGTGFFTPPAGKPDDPFDQIMAKQDFTGTFASMAAAFEDAASGFAVVDGGEPQPGDDDRVQILISVVDGFGPAGAMAADITNELVCRGVVTQEGSKALWRYLPKAMDQAQGDLRIVQPGGPRTRYFTQRHVHSQRRAA